MILRRVIVLFSVAAMLSGTSAVAQTTREKALASVYPGAEIRAVRVFLTADQVKRAREIASVELRSSLIAQYLALRAGKVVGRAYVDTHTVRTKNESLL